MENRIVLFALLVCTSFVDAAPTRFPEHNFSIEVPKGWTDIVPRPPQVVLAVQSPDNSQRVLAFAVKLPSNERASGAADMRAGAKKSMSDQGWRIDPEHLVTFNAQPFISFAGHVPTGETVTTYITGSGDEAYMLQAMQSGETMGDADLQSIVPSFRLLAPAEPLPLNNPSKSLAYRAGAVLGNLLCVGTIASFVIWLIKRGKAKGEKGAGRKWWAEGEDERE